MNTKDKGKVLPSPGIKTSISVSISLYKVAGFRYKIMRHIKKKKKDTYTYIAMRQSKSTTHQRHDKDIETI